MSNSFNVAALAQFKQASGQSVARTVTSRLRDTVSVKDFGAVGDGVANDTAAILAAISSSQGKRIYFPPGRYRYSGSGAQTLNDGTVVCGAGRNTTKIVSTSAAPVALFSCTGYGSGVESMGFESEVTQTGGCYVFLGGPESYITDFFMTGDYRGVIMFGNVSQIRHGRFQDAAPGGIRITCGGGDNSQTISNVLMGAQTPPNIATAGIRLQNCVALTISNVSVIQQGVGLLIDPNTVGQPVLNLYASQCFFDNCTRPILIQASNGAAAYRLYFTDIWASSGTDGVTLIGTSGGTVKGVHFTNLQANLNAGSGVATGGAVSELTFTGGVTAVNQYGFYFNDPVDQLSITGMGIGNYDGLGANTVSGIVFGSNGFSRVIVADNLLVGNTVSALAGIQNLANSRVENNVGYNPVGASSVTVGASPFTYTAGPSPESIYISGGSVSSISVSGQQLFTSTDKTVELGPNESVVLAYTVLPTVKKFVH